MTVLDLDKVVALLKDKGVTAYVEQTGGGTATIYAGEKFYREEERIRWRGRRGSRTRTKEVIGTDLIERYPALAGPGWFDGPNWTNGRADTSDFCVGPDDDGVSDPLYATDEWDEARVADELLKLVNA